jgi:hypothetical protein
MSDDLDFAQDSIKQVLSLATGVLALSFTFSSNFTNNVRTLAAAVVLSVWALLAATGQRYKHRNSKDWNIRLPWILQLATFVSGVVFLVAYAANHLPSG